MTPSEIRNRIESLRSEVAAHDERYYRKAKPTVDDQTYDRLKRELSDLESAHPELAQGASPTAVVGMTAPRASSRTATGRRCRASTTPIPRPSSGSFTRAW